MRRSRTKAELAREIGLMEAVCDRVQRSPQATLGRRSRPSYSFGIPTAMHRMIQQALHQVFSPIFEVGFSTSSYGFRAGNNTRQGG
ncbi:MAG: hypothetical protein Q8L82_04675 [Nitrosomonas sp.]|nr:hypothetical protein [Nitrosomonas sp.]